MNTQPIQFKRHKMTALLLAGLILAAGLAWIEVNMSQANRGIDSGKTDAVSYDSRLSPQLHLNSIKGGKGGIQGGDIHK